MCNRYSVCGKPHKAKWRLSHKRRNRKGQFVQEPRKLTAIFLGIVFVGAGFTIGWNTILRSVGLALQVENTQAVETIHEPSLEDKVYIVAKEFGISGYQMWRTIECETNFRNIQSEVVRNGRRENSWGYAQIHLPSWPEVTKWEALNEDFAIRWMATNWNKAVWYAYNRKTDRCVK